MFALKRWLYKAPSEKKMHRYTLFLLIVRSNIRWMRGGPAIWFLIWFSLFLYFNHSAKIMHSVPAESSYSTAKKKKNYNNKSLLNGHRHHAKLYYTICTPGGRTPLPIQYIFYVLILRFFIIIIVYSLFEDWSS